MTPKEKAKDLYGKFWRETPQPYIERVEFYKESKLIFNDWDKDWTNKLAKQCALIAVDEILNSYPHTYDLEKEYLRGGGASVTVIRNIRPNMNYWQEVKQEIERL